MNPAMRNSSAIRLGLLLAGVLLCQAALQGQGIRRGVICSAGASGANTAGYRLYATAAQPPNAGTVGNTAYFLRQGFQQPTTCAGAPQARFEVLPQGSDSCGGAYAFRYLDTPDPETRVFWTFGLGARPEASYEVLPPEVSYLAPGLKYIILEVLTEECRSIDTLELNVPVIPLSAVANVSDLWCREEEDGGISLFIQNGTTPYTVTWSNGQTGPEIGGLAPGAYAYRIADANNCILTGEAIVQSPDSLRADTLLRDESCNGSLNGAIALNISGGTAPYAYRWSDGATAPSLSNLAKGRYAVTVSDDHDCQLFLDFEIGRLCEGLVFYDVFSPNGDGRNDLWIIDGIERFPDNRLSIYDRWGLLVFQARGYANTWDGRRSDGAELPIGAYFYTLHLGDPANTVLKGAVTILR